jgi:hypothetical protein
MLADVDLIRLEKINVKGFEDFNKNVVGQGHCL